MSEVLVIKYARVNNDNSTTADEYQRLIETGLKLLSGESNKADAIRRYIPQGRVGMKVNCLTRNFNSTPVAMADGLTRLLTAAGFDENNLIVWDRTDRELKLAGYTLNASSFGPKCLGTDTVGFGYSSQFYSSGNVNSLVSRILTDAIDANINLPILKDHSIAGLSASLKNMFGAINNPNKYHGNNCSPFAAEISNLAPIKSKHRLSIIDAMKVQYNGGPGYDSRYIANYNGLIFSADPVAADTIGLEIIEHLRRRHNLPSLEQAGRPVKYLKAAEELGLGVADRIRIDLKTYSINGGESTETELF